MSRLLRAEEISHQIEEHQRWVHDDSLVASFDCGDFDTAIAFVNGIAREAAEMDHHPDIDIRYDTVVLTASTHSEGGVTQLDVELALRADQVFDELMAKRA